MGNYAKNRRLESASTSVVVPGGSTATRPEAPVFGQFRFNTDNGLLEFFNGSIFQSLTAGGSVSYTVDQFTGDGSTVVYTMSQTESDASQLIVFIGSIYQTANVAYTVDGGQDITFTSAPPDGEPISVIHTNS
jgi:hypothetical protein